LQASAAECLQQTESLFAKNHEPFFNSIGQQQTLVQRAEIERCNARAMSDCPQIAEVSLMR
jgi:hypothetical protein